MVSDKLRPIRGQYSGHMNSRPIRGQYWDHFTRKGIVIFRTPVAIRWWTLFSTWLSKCSFSPKKFPPVHKARHWTIGVFSAVKKQLQKSKNDSMSVCVCGQVEIDLQSFKHQTLTKVLKQSILQPSPQCHRTLTKIQFIMNHTTIHSISTKMLNLKNWARDQNSRS